MKSKRIILWMVAALITLGAAFYQKVTGPTYPKNTDFILNKTHYDVQLIRSHEGEDDATITLNIANQNVKAQLFYKYYPVSEDEEWTIVNFKHKNIEGKKVMTAKLPHQSPAGKLMYYITLTERNDQKDLFKENPIIIRFKGDVPVYILLPHVILIFFAMFIANVSGLFAAFKVPQFKRYTIVTLILMLIGGMILGPLVQKYAFLEYWTGVPNGWDLTDNKMLIAFIAWLVAFILNLIKQNRTSVIIAALVTIIIFSIPHSMFGSELNRETGEVVQGFIQLYF